MSSPKKRTPTCRTIELPFTHSNLVSIVDAWLQSVSLINDNDTIQDIEFGDANAETFWIKVKFKKNQRVEFIKHGST